MKIKSKYLFFLLIPSLAFISCQKENLGEKTEPQEFFNDGDHVFSYRCSGDDIVFSLEILADETDETTGVWPDVDTYRMAIDFNNNRTLDSEVDLILSPLDDGRICVSQLLTQNSTQPCAFYEDVIGFTWFIATENSSAEHVVHNFRIPKTRLSNSTVANISVEVYDPITGWNQYPDDSDLFSKTLEISW